MVAGATVAPLSGAAVVNDVTNEPQKRASDNRRVSCIIFYIYLKIYFLKIISQLIAKEYKILIFMKKRLNRDN